MKIFLLVFERLSGKLSLESFDDSERAAVLRRRAALEQQYQDQPDIEVVVLAADSLETLKRTHSRYFKSLAEIIADAPSTH